VLQFLKTLYFHLDINFFFLHNIEDFATWHCTLKWNISVTRIAFSPLWNVLGLISVLFLYPGKTFFLLITKARYLASYGFNIQIIRHFHTKKTKLFFLSYKVIDILKTTTTTTKHIKMIWTAKKIPKYSNFIFWRHLEIQTLFYIKKHSQNFHN